jgi:hypothetical protein
MIIKKIKNKKQQKKNVTVSITASVFSQPEQCVFANQKNTNRVSQCEKKKKRKRPRKKARKRERNWNWNKNEVWV